MFDPEKKRYLTRGVDETIPVELQLFMWQAIDQMPEPKDYLQVFTLSVENGLQCIHHTSEQPEYEMTYILPTVESAVTAKIYCIDSEDYCTMLLAEEYCAAPSRSDDLFCAFVGEHGTRMDGDGAAAT